MNVAVFGGSFDPVHFGHLIVADAAADALALDEVRFVPARVHPFKTTTEAAPADRLAMLELAVADDPRFRVDDAELRRAPPSYTSDTLKAQHDARPGDRLFLLLGADAAGGFGDWREPEAIARLATVVVLTRPGAVLPQHPLLTECLQVPAVDISATDIRERCRRGASIRYLVPDPVRRYIAERGLYREGS